MSAILDVLAKERILPVVVLDDAQLAKPLGEALLAGGLRCVEVTFRTQAAPHAISLLAEDPDLWVGAGTVLTVDQVDQAAESGARFVVSPGFSAAVVRRCQERDLAVFPGVATGTEIQMAIEAGLSTVKFFPAEQLGGAKMVNALAAPYPGVRFIPTGGVNPANLRQYLDLPSVLAVGGTWMVARKLLAAGRWAEVTALASHAVTVASQTGSDS